MVSSGFVYSTMYWTDWGRLAKIEMADKTGEGRKTIADGPRVKWPNGITLDVDADKLYWVDAYTDRVMCSLTSLMSWSNILGGALDRSLQLEWHWSSASL